MRAARPTELSEAQIQSLRGLKHAALDMDGTLYSGGTLFHSALPFLHTLRSLGIGFTFLTNNSSKSVHDYLAALGRFGIQAREENLYTSTLSAIDYINQRHPGKIRLFEVGTRSFREELQGAGFVCLEEDDAARPDIVLVGFDTALSYSRLCRAAYWIKQGCVFIATHPDKICPTDLPTVLIDCGAVCAALTSATGRNPDAVLGKPSPAMLEGILARHDLAPCELAMVGDRLYTDIEMARRTGALGVLVLSGETTSAEAQTVSGDVLVMRDVGEFGAALAQCRASSNPS